MSDNDAIEIRKDVIYATHDGVQLSGDLYLPGGAGPFPALVAVHGGGWRLGARSSFQYWGPHLAARGYRALHDQLSPGRQGSRRLIRRPLTTSCAAVQFVRGEAKAFNIDPERIALMGASAGAHLSGWRRLPARAFPQGLPGRQARLREPEGQGAGRRLRRLRYGRQLGTFPSPDPERQPDRHLPRRARPCRIASSISRLRRSATRPLPTTACRCS